MLKKGGKDKVRCIYCFILLLYFWS